MNRSCFYSILFLVVCCLNVGTTQLQQGDKDSLNHYRALGEWKSYFKKLSSLGNSALLQDEPGFMLKELEPFLLKSVAGDRPDRRFELRKAFTQQASKYKKSGDYKAALHWYLKAHELVNDPFCLDEWSWYVENEIANIYTRFDDFEKAEYFARLCEQSLIYYKNENQLCRLYANMGILFYSKAEFENAIHFYEKGLNLADKIKNHLGVLASSIGLAKVLMTRGNLHEVQKHLNIALKACEKLDTASRSYLESKIEIHWSLAKLYSRQNKMQLARREFQSTEEFLIKVYHNKNRREFAKLYYDLARFYFSQSEHQQTKEFLTKGIQSLIPQFENLNIPLEENALYPENTLTDLFLLGSDLLYQEYMMSCDSRVLKQSLDYLSLALSVNDKIRNSLLADPSKLINIESNKKLVDLGIRYLMELQMMDNSDEINLRARTYFDLSKALLLNEKSRQLKVLSIMQNADKELLLGLEKKEIELHEVYSSGRGQDSVMQAIIKLKDDINKIFLKYPEMKSGSTYPENYIEYNVQDHFVYAFAKLNGKIYLETVGSTSDLRNIYHDLNDQLLNSGMGIKDSILKVAYRFLLGFYNGTWPQSVSIIPDGIIQFIPFEILMDESGTIMLDKVTLSYALSYRQNPISTQKMEKSWKIYVVRPEYSGSADTTFIASRGNILPLLNTRKEIEDLKQIFGNQLVLDTIIDKHKMLDRMRNAEIVHYAGHAKVLRDSAFLILSDYANRMNVDEIQSIRNPVKLAVLSACETGLGEWEQGEGIRSLGKSFLESGAESVVMSLWSVNDESTAMIMGHFYRYLEQGLSKDQALREAKKSYLLNASMERRHPYFWAGFIVIGSTDSIDFHKLDMGMISILILIAMLVIMAYFKIFFKQKKLVS